MKSYLFLFLLMLYACHNGDTNLFNGPNIVVDQFPQTETPKGEKIDSEILGINDLYVIDTFLIAFKASGYNDFFEIYSTSDFKFMGKYLSKGRGPNEFLSIQYDNNFQRKNNDIILWVSDGALQKRAKLNLSKSLKTSTTICDTIFRIDGYDRYLNLNDSLVAKFKRIPGNISFKIQNNDNRQVISEKKLFKSYIPRTNSESILSMGVYKHPTKNIFVSNMLFFNQINVFTTDLKNSFSISYGSPCNIYETIKQSDTEIIIYYSSIVPTSTYIYALYINKKDNQFNCAEGPVEIHIFTWEGEAVSKIIIPDNIIYFAVDEKNQYIYGLKGNEEIIRYPFNMQ